jgi:hypothetical protein
LADYRQVKPWKKRDIAERIVLLGSPDWQKSYFSEIPSAARKPYGCEKILAANARESTRIKIDGSAYLR